jgi:hypothetical protein
MACKVISIRKCNIFEKIVKINTRVAKSDASGKLRSNYPRQQQVPCGSTQHVYFINYPEFI